MKNYCQNSGTFVDARDNQRYKWVQIGSQVWMAENLRYNAGRAGSGYYDLNLYGRVYNWRTAQRVCPDGWHLPSDQEWKILEKRLGMNEIDLNKMSGYERASGSVGFQLKSKTGWRLYMGGSNGGDNYGFRALPGGYYHNYYKRFMYYGTFISFWTSSSLDAENAIHRDLDSGDNSVGRDGQYKVHASYVRCVKNY